MRAPLIALAALTLLVGSARGQAAPSASSPLTRQVFAAESAFAATMATRDSAGFATFVAPDAVFFGDKSVLRGKQAVVDGWRRFFTGPAAPFSWRPEQVEVLASGTLAHSSGPVLDPDGAQVATFNSVWRREADGAWRVVFDKGCSCPRAP